MIVEDNTRMGRKPIKDIPLGECFKIDDTPGTLYLRISVASIPGLSHKHIPCVKILKGTVDILDADRLVYPVKSRLIIDKGWEGDGFL
jgi:hypothetical protein